MKLKKSLIALGVTCTLGVGGAFAATPYPQSVNEATPWMAHLERQDSMIHSDAHAFSSDIGSTSTSASSSVSSGDEFASLDQGVYSDFYTVSAPVMVEQWDYYVLSSNEAGDELTLTPIASTQDYWMVSSVEGSEDLYVLSPSSYNVVTLHQDAGFAFDGSSPAM